MKKRILSILLTFCMVLMLVPTTVFAADKPGDVHALLEEVLNKGGTQKLQRDYIVTRLGIRLGKSVTIDLNGHVILFQGGHFLVGDSEHKNIQFTIKDSLAKSGTKPKHTGQFAGLPDGGVVTSTYGGTWGGCVNVTDTSTFNLEEGATLYNSYASTNSPGTSSSLGDGEGGAVFVDQGGTFNMKGGTIDGCTASTYGGAVYINGGTFNMTGGTIKNCKAVDSGGAVCLYSANSIFNMTGGTIENCKISSSSSVANSTRGFGGGVFVRRGNFTMTGGTIENCETSTNGGGVDVKTYGTFNMKGGTIKNCKATYSAGGVNNHGTFNMTGGTIDNCSAKLAGGGVCHESTSVDAASFIMTGGTIKNCSAENGGGVATHQNDKDLTFTMTGGAIDNCSAKIFGGGMFIENNGDCTLEGGTINNCSADYGGGVFVKYGDFIMKSGTIENCFARTSVGSYGYGGGVNIYYGNFTMTGGTVKDCTSTYSENNALCLFSNATMIADGGSIKGTSIIYSLDSTISKIKNTSSAKYTKFYGFVENQGTISGGVFYGGIQNKYSGTVTNPYKIVTFDLNGATGSVPNQWLVNAKGATANRPTDPTWEGYKFMGWYNGNTVYDFTTAVPDNIKIFTLKAKWVNSRVSTEAELKEAINAGITSIKLIDDITLSNILDLSDKDITLDLNGHILTGDIKLSDTLKGTNPSKLTLIDSNPTATHTNSNLPLGGVLDGEIMLDKTTFGILSRLCANGGTVTGRVSLDDYNTQIVCTSTTPTAFMDSVEGSGEIHGGMFYGGVKQGCIEERIVTFLIDGQRYAVGVVEIGKNAVAPIEPVKDGYVFAGWYIGNTKFNFQQPVMQDVVLNEKWVNEVTDEETLRTAINEGITNIKLMADINLSRALDLSNKNITIDLNGYVISGADISINAGNGKANLTLKDSRPTATHTDSTLPKGGVVKSKISMKKDGGSYNDCVLYANGGTVTSDFYTNTHIVSIKCTSNTPTAFTGNISGYVHLYGGIYYGSIASSVTIEAKKITFKNGNNTYAYEVVDTGNKTVTPINPPIKEGYNGFDGWYNGDTKYTFGSTLSEDITLTAKFSNPKTYNISYKLDGGTATNPATYTVESEDITLNNPKKTGYTFTGWSGTGLTGENYMTVTIAKGSKGDRTYTAHFSQNNYTVKFDTNGGSSISDKTGVKWTDTVLSGITAPTKDGFEFTGWKCGDMTVNANTKYSDLAANDAAASVTLVAQWKDIQKPVITGLENGKTYCDDVEFEVSDNDGIESVKAGNTELTESNGKYTLEKGIGTVTVVATDKAGNTAQVSVTVNNGHTYGEWQLNGYGTHTRYCTVTGCNGSEDGKCTGGQASYFKKAVCDECNEAYGALLTDSTAPTGEISIGTNKWNSFLNTITFGLFFKNTQSVTITATDDSYNHDGYTDDKAVKVEYYLYSGDTALTQADLASKEFTIYDGGFNINPDNKYVIYVRLTDHAGNVTYISSEGVVLDASAPVISGVENGKTYCEAQTVTVMEEYIESVKVNGTAVTLDANNQFTLNPAEGTQTIVVTDKAGNETSVTVTVNDGHTAGNDDGDCSTPVYCIYHPDIVVVAAKSHDFSGEWHNDGTGHWHVCQNDGCTVSETETPHSGTDDGDCTTAVICECGYVITAANAEHSYGECQSNGDDTHTRYCTVDGCSGYEDGNCEGGQASYFKKAVCDECNEAHGELLTDKTAPTGEISIGTNKWNSFLNTITFGLFFKDTQSVTVTAADDSYNHDGYTDDKAVKVAYYLYSGDTVLTKEDLASKEFTIYDGGFNINPDNKYVIYARLTDHAGNVTYISSEGVVLDASAPVISGVENGKTYCEAQTVTVMEEYIESVKVNGTAVTLDANNQFTLNPAESTQTIVVTDKAGNEISVTVTVNDGHTYEWQSENGQYWKKCMYCGYETAKKDIPTITIDAPDTVCRTQDCEASVLLPENIANAELSFAFIGLDSKLDSTVEDGRLHGVVPARHYPGDGNSFNLVLNATTDDGFLFTVRKNVKIQNEHAGGVATCIELAICDTCGEHYGEFDSSNHNLEKIPAKDATVTATGNKEYWHCKDCKKYFSDAAGTNEIKLDDTVIAKLSPEIIEGKGQSITAGEKKELIFKSNASFSDFIRVELDGKTLDEKNYTVKEGSTVVTLKADYVATLSVGEHTIGIVSASGTATTTFIVNAKAVVDNDTKSPQTGDNSHMALWIALLAASMFGFAGTAVCSKRKRVR
ncbi:InlB B-repeat-containing protein [Oscillospiraceae bacterium LCP25S3_F9]